MTQLNQKRTIKASTNLPIQLKYTRTITKESFWNQSEAHCSFNHWLGEVLDPLLTNYPIIPINRPQVMENHLQYLLRNDNQKVQLSLQFMNGYKNHISKTSSKRNPLRQTGLACNAARPLHVKSVTHRRGLCQFKSSDRDGCLPTDIPGCGMSAHTKTRTKQASTEAFVAQDEGKMGEGANRQGERSGLPLLEEAICPSAGLPPIRDLDSSRELRTG